MNITLKEFGSTLAHSFGRAVLIALYLTAAIAASPAFGADGEVARTTTSPDAQGVLAACGLMVLTVGAAVAQWFREEPV